MTMFLWQFLVSASCSSFVLDSILFHSFSQSVLDRHTVRYCWIRFRRNAFRCDLCFVLWCTMSYNGSGGKRLCTGTDLDVERVRYNIYIHKLTSLYLSRLDENGRVLCISRFIVVLYSQNASTIVPEVIQLLIILVCWLIKHIVYGLVMITLRCWFLGFEVTFCWHMIK